MGEDNIAFGAVDGEDLGLDAGGDPWAGLAVDPFVHLPRDRSDMMASLDWYDGHGWYGYTTGYLRAAMHIYNAAVAEPNQRESLMFPMVYLFRQTIELKLKQTIKAAVRTQRTREVVSDEEERRYPADGHDLKKLTRNLEGRLRAVWPDDADLDVLLERLHEHLAQWHRADPRSTAFRYPEQRDGSRSVELRGRVLNLTVVMETAREVYGSLDAIDAELQRYRDELNDHWSHLDAQGLIDLPRPDLSPGAHG